MAHRRRAKVLVIGADGVLGGLTADAFRDAGWTVRFVARRGGPERVRLELDSPESVAAALEEHELLVKTVPHPGLFLERAVLERGGALINTSALPAAAGRSLRAVAAGARGTVLMNAGVAPGVTNLVAADLLRTHSSAEELEIVFMVSAAALRGSGGAEFLHRSLVAVARHRTALIPLPDPFGARTCLGFAEAETGWLGGVAEGRVVRLYVCVTEPAAHERVLMLNRAGTMHRLSRSLVEPHPPVGTGASGQPVAHWIAVRRRGRRLAARTVECRGGSLHTARTTVVFAERLIEQPQPGGCFDPEEICTLAQIEGRLSAAGVKIVSQPV